MLFGFHNVRVNMRLIKAKGSEKLLTVSFFKKKIIISFLFSLSGSFKDSNKSYMSL